MCGTSTRQPRHTRWPDPRRSRGAPARLALALGDQRSRQLAAGPRRERACLVFRQLAGELDQVRRHDRGKNAGAARFEVRRRDHVARIQRTAAPTFERSCVGGRPAGSPLLARTRQRASGACRAQGGVGPALVNSREDSRAAHTLRGLMATSVGTWASARTDTHRARERRDARVRVRRNARGQKCARHGVKND